MKKQTLLCLTLTLLGMVLLCSLAISVKASDPVGRAARTYSENTVGSRCRDRNTSAQRAAGRRGRALRETRDRILPTLLFSSGSVNSRTVGMERAMKDGDC